MPTYQYACTECDHAFEQFQSFSDDALTVCPVCEGRLRKVFNAVGVVFKGSGFYRNDSRSEGRDGASKPVSAEKSEKSAEKAEKSGASSGEKSGEKSGESLARRSPAARSPGGEKKSDKPSTSAAKGSGTSESAA